MSKPVEVTADSLLTKYGAPNDPTFEIKLPDGEVLKFRRITTYPELKRFMAETARFVKGNQKAPHPAWKEVGELTDEALSAAYMISELSVEPKFEQLDAFKLTQAAWLTQMIMDRMDANRMKFQVEAAEAERITEEKNA